MAAALHSNADIFAANRATGHIALRVAASGGRTRRARVHEDGSLRVRFPNAAGEALEAVIVNTGGGMTGGDRFAVEIALGEGARLIAGTRGGGKNLSLDRAGRGDGRQARRRRGRASSPGCRRRPFCSTARAWRAASTSSSPRAPRC